MDIVDSPTRSRMMAGIRGRNTVPELVVRKFLWSRGFRYRLHVASLPGRPDIVLSAHRSVVEVRGCFWHGHIGCRYYRVPKTRRSFWLAKIRENRARDRRNSAALERSGWRTFVVWECALRTDAAAELDRLEVAIRKLR